MVSFAEEGDRILLYTIMAIDREQLIEKIKRLDGLTMQERNDLVAYLREHKVYGLVWEDRPEDVERRLRTELPVLKEVKSRAIISDNQGAPNHIIIEGDNLDALAALAYTHESKIDVIYIDPPYNRGKDDFRYNDDYIDEDNPFKHSLWLCFMSKRLRIAKRLLSPHGVIIAHIDEHEFDAFNLILSEIFGGKNSLGQIIWNKMNPKGDAHAVSYMHEYILIYCKSKESFLELEKSFTRPKRNAQKMIAKANRLFSRLGESAVPSEITDILKLYGFKNEDAKPFSVHYTHQLINSEFQKWLSRSDFSKGEKAYKYIHPNGRVFRTVSMAWPNKERAPEEYWIPLSHPITQEECPLPSKGWRFPPVSFKRLLGSEEPLVINDDMIVKGEIVFTRKKNGQLNIPERIYWLDENMEENVPSIYEDGSSDESLLADLSISFDYPKTISVGKYLLSSVNPSASIILDFFAGSGTALHATMQLNSEDGGNRRCILVTNNENGICENVTYERNRRVIEGYTTPKGENVAGLNDNNLRYYRTAFVGRRRTPQNMRRLMLLASDMLCIKENIYTEFDKFCEMNTLENGFRYFANGGHQMLIIYDETVIYKIVDALLEIQVEQPIITYVFSPANDPWQSEFVDVADKVKLTALPSAIYNAYKRVLPKPDYDGRKQELDYEEPEGVDDTADLVEEGGEA